MFLTGTRKSSNNRKASSVAAADAFRRTNLSSLHALAAITASDEAKVRFLPCPGSIECLCNLLSSPETDMQVKLTALKVVSNAAVFPAARGTMRSHPFCLRSIRALKGEGNGGVLARHAKIAEDAVLWEA